MKGIIIIIIIVIIIVAIKNILLLLLLLLIIIIIIIIMTSIEMSCESLGQETSSQVRTEGLHMTFLYTSRIPGVLKPCPHLI